MKDDDIEYLPVVNPHGQHPPTERVIKWVRHNGKIVAVPVCQQCHPWRWKDNECQTAK